MSKEIRISHGFSDDSFDMTFNCIYNINMPIYEWDEGKRKDNICKHGIDFTKADNFEWDSAIVIKDDRKDYGEIRYRTLGLIEGRVYAMAFTSRNETVRIISLRKANPREVKKYESIK